MSEEERKGLEWVEDFRRQEQLSMEAAEAYIALVKARECEVCSKQGERVQLIGGRSATLCNTHLSAWRECVVGHSLYGLFLDAEADYGVAVRQRTEEVAKKRNRIRMAVNDSIYELSGEWLEEAKMKWQ